MKCEFVGILLLTIAGALHAQEAAEVPAANEAVAETAGDVTEAAERDALEPGVPSTVLANEARRTETGSRVMDEIDLERTEITGNQELPKVLYIVPWQKSDPGDLMGKPVNTLLDEVLAPIDRGEFVRQVRYYDELRERQE
ncbi:hypothetical protein [Woeseia oceani]|nr:hypothetical protein [Woeseia oceani]